MRGPASLCCAENIALLHLLHAGRGKDGTLSKDSVPTRPSVGPVEPCRNRRGDYTLSLERERSLAGALAFISHTEDDPDHIPAVCIQEDHSSRGNPSLRILLAVNRSKRKDGGTLLEKIKFGFERIFEKLSGVVDDNDNQLETEHEIRRLIVSMCSHRILSRLDLIGRAGKKTRQHPKLRFQRVIHALPHGRATLTSSQHATVSGKERNMFIEKLKGVVTLIDIYTNHPRQQELEDLIDAFYRLRQVDCQALLDTIPDDIIERDSKKRTLIMIHKVARYAEAARFLYRTSKRFPIVRRMQVVAISLPGEAFSRVPLGSQYRIDVSSMLSRVNAPRNTENMNQESQADALCHLLRTTTERADGDLTEQAIRTHKTGKVHAEVQLVLHCEMLERSKSSAEKLFLPRIVSSSKKACFLCDLFIKMHGKMRTPWSHGKLYPGWRVPEWSGLGLQKLFNSALEDRIRMSIALLFERRERTSYPGPSESTLITLPSLDSEPVSVVGPRHDDEVRLDNVQAEGSDKLSESDTDTAKSDDGHLNSISESVSNAAHLGPLNGTASAQANERVECDLVSQHAPSNLSCRSEKRVDAGSQHAGRIVQGHPSYEEPGNVANTAHLPSSLNYSDHNKHDKNVAGDEDIQDIVEGPTRSTHLKGPSFRSPKSCADGIEYLQEYHHLRQGQKLTQSIRPEHTKTFFTRSLVVDVEYSTGLSLKAGSDKQPQRLPITIDRLGVDEITRLKDEGTILIGKAEAIIGEDPVVLPSMENLYVAARGEVFRITFH